MSRTLAAAAVLAAASFVPAEAQTQSPAAAGPGVSTLDVVQVTANRFAEPVQEVPSAIEVISGDELRARGANDLRTALSLVGGVSVAPGGDEGPGGSVPGLLGQRETDDLLLLIDGVPAGGAFIPQLATLDLANVERIEVQRGPAPVLYGTSSFEGTINVIHYAAGQSAHRADVAYGSFGSVEGGSSAVLAQGRYRASISADGARERYSDPRAGLDRGHALLRSAADVGGGEARLDFDLTVQHQKPTSPRPLNDDGDALDPDVPNDFNQNPADGKIDTNRYQLTGAYDHAALGGVWNTTLSLTQTQTQLVQGFFNSADGDDDDDVARGRPVAAADDPADDNATGFHQRRQLSEIYFDSHLTRRFGAGIKTTFGISELWGLAHQNSQVFGYTIPDAGEGPPPSSGESDAQGSAYLSDQRSLVGLYAQTRWALTPRLGLLAGLRLNHTDERRGQGDGDADDATLQYASTTRLSGSLGANWRVWQDPDSDLDDVVLYTAFANTFQPPEIDFGPDEDGPLLRPETLTSYEAGAKADGFDGRFDADLAFFLVDFDNQAVATEENNVPTVMNAGRERYKGAELEFKYRPLNRLTLTANYNYSDARYRGFDTLVNATQTQFDGNRLPLTPGNLAALGAIYSGPQGPQASLVANYVGDRYLDMSNEVTAKSYITLDGTLGYAFHRYTVTVAAYNMSNRRDPSQSSELGDGQYYPLPGRRLFVKLSAAI